MSIKLKDGCLQVPVDALFDGLSEAELMEVVDALSCIEKVIEHVTAQLLDGCTDLGSYGATSSGSVTPYTALDEARREIAVRSSEVAAREIADLKSSLIRAQEDANEYSEAYFRLYHAWDHTQKRIPDGPHFSPHRDKPRHIVVEAPNE